MKKEKIRYAVLKVLEDKKDPFSELNPPLDEENIAKQGSFLANEGYISRNSWYDNKLHIWGELTEKGEKYLKDNNSFAKAYQVAKEVRDWMPFFKKK